MNKKIVWMLLATITTLGCQTPKFQGGSSWFNRKEKPEVAAAETPDESETGKPVKIVAVWKDGTLDANGKRVRGLAGRVYFYDAAEKAVRVEGSLSVYGYEESGLTISDKTEADKHFAFREHEMQSHYSESDIGASYSFWLPWDEVGSYAKGISVLPILRTADGRLVRGELASAALPGPKEPISETAVRQLKAETKGGEFAQQVLYESDAYDQQQEQHKRMKTKTIRIPSEADSVRSALQNAAPLSPRATPAVHQSPLDVNRLGLSESQTAGSNGEAAEQEIFNRPVGKDHWESTMQSYRRMGPKVNHGLPGVHKPGN